METRPAIHPSADALRAFALGKLDDSTASVLMSHLDSCADCCKEVAAMTNDDFLARLRQAYSHSGTPAPGKSLDDATRAPQPSVRPSAIPNLPPELANNPQYEILRELGRGGMGVVYLAKNKLMDRMEVLKVVNKALLDRPGAVERFFREIRSAAKLSHANIVAAYSALQLGELLAFAMEYVEGDDLAKLVKTQGPLPVIHACYYIQQAALGVQHAYENGMVHRDIKPQNLILARKAKKHLVKVLDFGLAKATREKAEDTGLTGEGAMLGTPDYVAPEQTLDAARADIRADIYSLGCTLYYLLSGKPPFQGKSLYEVLQAHHSMEAKPLNLVRPEVPEELAAVVRKMMAKDPAQRYQTPAEVVQALGLFGKQGAKGTSPKAHELSMGTAESQSAGGKTTQPERPVRPSMGVEKPKPATMEALPSVAWETLNESSVTSTGLRKSGAVRKRQQVAAQPSSKKWLIGGGIGVGVLLLGLLGLWASGVFKVKTKDGILVIDVNEANSEVYVDGTRVTVSWDDNGKKAEVRVKPGAHRVEVKKDGFSVDGAELTFNDGEKAIFTARLLPVKREAKGDVPAPEKLPPLPDAIKPDELPPQNAVKRDVRKLFKVRRNLKGKWIIVDDHLEQTSFDENVCLYFGDPTWKDYDFAVDVMRIAGNDQVCQLFRLEGRGAFYYGLGHLGNNLFTIESGRQRLGSFKGRVEQRKWYKMLVRVRGKHMQCFLNDATIFDFESDDHPSGCVGLRTYWTQYRFCNIKVTAPDGTVLLEGLPDLNHELPDETKVAPAATNDGFVPLFNGKDLTGWKVFGGGTGNWRVEDGILIGSRPTSHLFSERGDYENFHYLVEAMINDGGNSGQYFRAEYGPRFPKGYEAQINSTRKDSIKTGSLYNIVNVTDQLHKPNEWFKQEVIAQGDHIVIKVNDKTVVDTHDSRYKKGHFALQQHDPATVVKFRKIEVKVLDTASPPARAESRLPPEAKEAAKAFAKACEEARAKLLAEFDTVLDRLTKNKGSTEQRLKMINVVKEEKKRFESSGLIPWSEPMRSYLTKYILSNKAAEDKLRRVYTSLIDAQPRAKNESMAADLKADLENLLRARVVARWRHFWDGKFNRTVTLYSNWRAGKIDGNSIWIYDKGVLIYRWPQSDVPGGVAIDRFQISADGLTYDGTCNIPALKRVKIHGVYLNGD